MREVGSLAELREVEAEALAQLKELPNGELLFFVDPVRALADAGFRLSEPAAKALRPHVEMPDGLLSAYSSIRESEEELAVVQLRGLFDWSRVK